MNFRKRLLSFKFALQGIFTLFTTQVNAVIHLTALIAVIILGILFDITRVEWLTIIIAATLVLMAEAFNTAIEFLTDLASPTHHPLAGKAKDVAAAAVLIAAIGAAIVGTIIFFPYLKNCLLNKF